jgi:hypothetical protein
MIQNIFSMMPNIMANPPFQINNGQMSINLPGILNMASGLADRVIIMMNQLNGQQNLSAATQQEINSLEKITKVNGCTVCQEDD